MSNVNTTRDAVANHIKTLGSWISLHTASPGQTGASEVTGGSPAYARKQTTWGTATGGTGLVTGSEVVIDVPPSTTVSHVGICSASTGAGTVVEWSDSADITYTPQGQVKVTPKIQHN